MDRTTLVGLLAMRRNNDVFVKIGDQHFAVAGVAYDAELEGIVLALEHRATHYTLSVELSEEEERSLARLDDVYAAQAREPRVAKTLAERNRQRLLNGLSSILPRPTQATREANARLNGETGSDGSVTPQPDQPVD